MNFHVPTHLTSQIVFVNGSYVLGSEACVSIFDRGMLMGDAVYEVTAIMDGKLLEFDGHMARLKRSLDELEINFDFNETALLDMHHELMRRNNLTNGVLYLQISRGVSERMFGFPRNVVPTVIAFVKSMDLRKFPGHAEGLRVISYPEGRWARRDIKTTQLLWASMSKMAAQRAGVDDVFFVDNGIVTEGSSCNAFIIKDNILKSHALSNDILHGITRAVVMRFAEQVGLHVVEEPFTIEEAQAADEVFVTGSPIFVLGVAEVDKVSIGNGLPGPRTMQLRLMHINESLKTGV